MKTINITFVLVVPLSVLPGRGIYAQDFSDAERPSEMSHLTAPAVQRSKSSSDSVTAWPKKLRDRRTWERIVSFPGDLVYFPVGLFFDGLEASIAFVDESKLVPKAVDFLTCDDGSCGALPTYTSQSGAGFKFFQKGLLSEESKLTLALTAGQRGRQRYQLRLSGVRFFGGSVFSEFLGRYRFLSDESFFGLGPKSRFVDETNFAHEQATVEAALGANLHDRFRVNAKFGLDLNNILEGRDKRLPSATDLPQGELPPGIEDQVRIVRLEISGYRDSKNRPGNPSGGTEALVQAGVFVETGDSQYRFWKVSGDLTRHIHLFYGRVLVVRVAGEVTEPISDKGIPFYYLSKLGRHETIRGFRRGRFRDRDMLLGVVEYRYPIQHPIRHRWADALLFVDAGKVSSDIFDDSSGDGFHVSYGAGIRVWSRRGLIARLEVGMSSDGFRVHFGLN